MDVKPSYKQTEVGVIPADWESRRIDTVCRLINGRGFKPFEWQNMGLPIIRIQNLNGSDDFNFYTGAYDKKLEVKSGQLLFAWSGSRGTSFGPHIWHGPLGLLNYHTWKVQVHETEIKKEFFLHALRQLTTFIEGKAHGASALVHTQKGEMEGFEFPLPPTKAEQEAIAGALSDADALIESLEQLLNKKRQIKTGAMQELLTGKKRLPGFGGQWETLLLGDLEHRGDINLNRGNVISKKMIDCTPGGYPIYSSSVHSNGLFGCWGEYMFDEELITWSVDGGGHFFYRPKHRFSVTNVCGYLRIFTKSIQYRYLSYQLQEMHSRLFFDYTSKAHPSVIRGAYKVSLPSIEEQHAIATILSDMDAEIDALETKLSKARLIKQGMMQELLTGRIRLI